MSHFKKSMFPKYTAVALLSAGMLIGCSSDDGHPRLKEFSEKTVQTSSQGVEAEIEEQEPGDSYLIVDERLIDDKEASRAIIHNLDNSIDTVSFAKLNSGEYETRYSRIRPLLMYGIARSYFSGNMANVTPTRSGYKNQSAYNKSMGLKDNMMATSKPRTVRVPKGTSSGYGSGRSFRSFGG